MDDWCNCIAPLAWSSTRCTILHLHAFLSIAPKSIESLLLFLLSTTNLLPPFYLNDYHQYILKCTLLRYCFRDVLYKHWCKCIIVHIMAMMQCDYLKIQHLSSFYRNYNHSISHLFYWIDNCLQLYTTTNLCYATYYLCSIYARGCNSLLKIFMAYPPLFLFYTFFTTPIVSVL